MSQRHVVGCFRPENGVDVCDGSFACVVGKLPCSDAGLVFALFDFLQEFSQVGDGLFVEFHFP